MKDPVRDALDFSNFVCLALCQQYASFSKTRLFGTEEDELAVFAGSDVDLVAYKGTHIPVFPDTTDVDSLTLTVSRPLLLFFLFSGFPHSILATISLVLAFLFFLVFLVSARGLKDLPWWSGPPSRTWEETKPETLPAFHRRWLLTTPISDSVFYSAICLEQGLINRLSCLASTSA